MKYSAPKNIMDYVFKLGMKINPATACEQERYEGNHKSLDNSLMTLEEARMYSGTLFRMCGYVPRKSPRLRV